MGKPTYAKAVKTQVHSTLFKVKHSPKKQDKAHDRAP